MSTSMQQSSTVVPLTDLCAICHVNPIKYTCPRDGIHTCSLPCVKRHKQWAQCSGVRNPAEYRKRSELATAASIDKDFNFITNVERSLSKADNTALDRGIDLVPARVRPHDTRPKFEIEAEGRGIVIRKAPKGLSRSKQNKTHWGGQPKCIIWTVEWVCEDGRRVMSAAPEIKSVKDLFNTAAGPKRNPRKRKRPSDAAGNNHDVEPQILPVTQSKSDDQNVSTEADNLKHGSGTLPAQLQAFKQHNLTEIETEPASSKDHENPLVEQYFYLHRPNTESRLKCLIHITSSSTLQEALNNRTLIEFPTFYVRSEAPDQLQPPFITNEEYLRRHGDDIPINVSAPGDVAGNEAEIEDGEYVSDVVPSDINEAKVLEVLAKDLGS